MSKKLFENIIFIFISIIILLIGLLIGSPIKYNCTIVTILTMATYIIYLIGKLCIYKDTSIIKNRFEFFIILLCVSTCIPLIFKKYITLNDTVYNIFKYLTILPIYIIIRDLCIYNKKYIGYIINVIIISATIILIFGIDKMSTKWFSQILKMLNTVNTIDNEHRMISTFGYANSFAVCMAFALFLSIGQYIKKQQLIYGVTTFLFMIGLILSYSRATLILVLFAFILYLIIINSKKQKINAIEIFILSLTLSILYSKIFVKLTLEEKNILLWIITIILCLTVMIVCKLMKNIYKYIEKLSKKVYIIISVVIVGICIIMFIVGLFWQEPLIIFNNKNKIEEVKYKIPNIKGNEVYELEFDIEANSKLEKDIYTIQIEEENKYYDTIKQTSIQFGNYIGNKIIRIETLPDTIEFALYFKSKSEIIQNGLKINNLKINGKNYPINYKYIPIELVTKFKSINIKNKSIWERKTFYQDAVQIIKQNWLFGIGRRWMEI